VLLCADVVQERTQPVHFHHKLHKAQQHAIHLDFPESELHHLVLPMEGIALWPFDASCTLSKLIDAANESK